MAAFNTHHDLPICPACRSRHRQTKAGRTLYGDQRYQCQDCKRYYSACNRKYRYPEGLRQQAVHLYDQGLSLRQVADLLSVNHQTVSNWIKAQTTENEKLQSSDPCVLRAQGEAAFGQAE